MSTGLHSRPIAETFPLDDLVERARAGSIRIPTFQRGLKWTRSDVVQLFDSILKGYPVGSLLFWERDAPAETVTLGPLSVAAEAGTALYVVDGQQRLTALAAALSADGDHDQRYQIGYDLTSESFVGRSARSGETYVPAYVLFDLSVLLTWFRDRPELADRFEAAAAVSKTLRDLRIPAYVVRQDDETVLRSIFDRMNNAGKKLTRGEVFAALHHTGEAAGSPLHMVSDAVQARTGFGMLNDGTAMQVVLSRRGSDVTREIRNEFEPSAVGRDRFAASEPESGAYAGGVEAAVRAIDFMQNTAGVPHLALLPYQYLLVTLVRFFAHHPEPSPRGQRLLRRWFWRAVVAGPTIGRGNTSGVSRKLNHLVQPDDESASIGGLLDAVGGSDSSFYPDVNPFLTNSAATKTLLCALWALGPFGMSSGTPVHLPELLDALAEQQTAKDLVVPIHGRRYAGVRYREAGNRVMLVSSVDQDEDISTILPTVGDAVLASYALTVGDVAVLGTGDAEGAIHARNARLRNVLAHFLDRMCEWNQEDTPDLAVLIGKEEEHAAG